MNKFYVYIYFDPSKNSEPFYVGKGTGKRYKKHLKRVDKHPLTSRLHKMKLLGIIPIIEKLETLTEFNSFELEKLLISAIGRKDLKTGPLLNLTDGGEGASGFLMTEKSRNKIRDSATGKPLSEYHKQKQSEAQKRRWENISNEELSILKNKISIKLIGRKLSKETKMKMSKPQKIIKCPHCGKEGGISGMTRFHFENCKTQA